MKILEAVFSFYLRLAELFIRLGLQVLGVILAALVNLFNDWRTRRHIAQQSPGIPRRRRPRVHGRRRWQKRRI